ncbi:hypothetical protein FQN57_007083 [Myotisia sp. PD_48]|nr:hypothetical protein FQN57_007083 [Myotisia sp. PD_48]
MEFHDTSIGSFLRDQISHQQDDLVSTLQSLIRAASPNPSGDTSLVANVAIKLLKLRIPGVEISRYEPAPGIVNVVARIPSGRPGKRLVFNGHLDTFPIGENLDWTVPPIGGILKGGRVYGRGAGDMKGGIAASMTAAIVLSAHRDLWCGEIVLTLAGDEETMGNKGTKWLLDNVPEATGDAMVCGDAGSPGIIRFGEKGFVWLRVDAVGTRAHGAHVHLGINAINRLRAALDAVQALEEFPVPLPAEVRDAIDLASERSESISGAGESDTLRHVTVNIGTIEGGVSPNLVPSHASAQCDIRLPPGVSTKVILAALKRMLGPMQGISWSILRKFDPIYTSPEHELVQLASKVAFEVTKLPVVSNMRVGASDSRLYRSAGIPSIVVGCSANNMGAADEYVEVAELVQLAQIHGLIAYDYLKNGSQVTGMGKVKL